ncbi:DUF4136 domain-containing protein [Zunongwangia endophytica]|uniref:DUF4136 domain-containing protein n=1 Tax=Zunongwangia endophytica TaxID=1808945 RepID=A0ABV8H5L7_9FLAO|nr:DUF4136 domain-containing protein [Zunongwangia endophytica]MDN3596407.1 DUF4136 domain-containing protein [Zunongwangia endophytica]
MKLIFKLILFSLLVASCNTPRTVYDYDAQTNFDLYKSYQLFPDFQTGMSQLDEKRIINSIDHFMREKNLALVEKNPDMYVNLYTEQFQEQNSNTLGVGIGSGGGNVGVGVSGGIPLGGPKDYLRFIIDFIDVEKDALIWKAEVEVKFNKNANPDQRQALFDKVIAKALEGYPPIN